MLVCHDEIFVEELRVRNEMFVDLDSSALVLYAWNCYDTYIIQVTFNARKQKLSFILNKKVQSFHQCFI